MKKVIFISIVLLTVLANNSFAQAGSLDYTFGINGKVTTLLSSNCQAYAVALQPDGKILAAGNSSGSFAIVRYNPNGSLDSIFGTNGKVIVAPMGGILYSGGFYSLAVQTDGKIITSGGGDGAIFLMRFNGNGSVDSTFGTDGTVIWAIGSGSSTAVNKLIIQPDGKIVAGGLSIEDLGIITNEIILGRFNTDGSFDSTFMSGIPFNNAGAFSMALQSDGKIVLAGYIDSGAFYFSYFGVFRCNLNGTPDSSFGLNGMVTTKIDGGYGLFKAVAIQPDSKIVSAGDLVEPSNSFTGSFILIRYKADGSLDSTFSQEGILTTSVDSNSGANSMAIQSDNKIIAAGFGHGFTLVRCKTDGSLDDNFGGDGIVTTDVGNTANSVVMQPDGKILVAGGNGGFILARFLSRLNVGVLNLSSNDLPVLIYPNPIQSEAVFEYILPNEEHITISLYNIKGDQIQTFVSNETEIPGEHKEVLHLDPSLPGGNYILSISNGVHRQNIKIVKE